jgi:hypothetical protein
MKKFMKFVGAALAIFVILGIIGNMMGSKSEPATKVSEPKTETTQPVQQPAKTEQPAKVSKENFDKIKTGDGFSGDGGMSVDDVKAMLGEPETDITSTSSINGKDYRMDVMTWSAGLQFKSITVTFMNGFASAKSFVQ